MKLYLLLSNGGMVSNDPNERAETMKELTAWFAKIGSALVDGGAALTGKTRTVSSDEGYSAASRAAQVNGYMLIKADSMDAAADIAKGYPLLKRGFTLDVFETFKEAK